MDAPCRCGLAFDLAAEGQVFAVADDGGVAEAVEKISKITVFKSIKNLLESDEFEEALADIGVDTETEYEKANIEKVVMEFLRDHARFHRAMEDNVASLVAGKTLDYRNPNYDEKEGPGRYLNIDSVEEVSDWAFDGSSDYLGEGVILVNFEARVEVSADDPMGGPRYDEEGNLDSSRMVTISGAVSISFDQVDLLQYPINTSGQELLKAATVSIDELDDISLIARSY